MIGLIFVVLHVGEPALIVFERTEGRERFKGREHPVARRATRVAEIYRETRIKMR